MSEWIKFDGRDEHIAEIKNNRNGYIVRGTNLSNRIRVAFDLSGIDTDNFEYLICNPHPLADMIIRWAQTGQPVWVKAPEGSWGMRNHQEIGRNAEFVFYVTTTPDWNIPNAEYSFTPFEDCLCISTG